MVSDDLYWRLVHKIIKYQNQQQKAAEAIEQGMVSVIFTWLFNQA